MGILVLFVLASVVLTGVSANTVDDKAANITSSELPKMYQLDDYDRCLSRPGALYCVGTFRLTADRQAPSYSYYRMIEEYSSEPRHLNRTLLYRGYCLSSRCPDLANATHRDWFSSCVQTQEASLGLKINLQSYHCTQSHHTQASEAQYRTPGEKFFLWVIAVLLALNLFGTLHDVMVADEEKNKILVSWSVRNNWQSLKNTLQKHKNPQVERFSSFTGFKVMFHILFIGGHVMAAYHQIYLSNPRALEQMYFKTSLYFVRNGQLAIQAFVMFASIVYTNSQITFKRGTNLSQLPLAVLKRIARFLPVHLLVVGFAATWWRYTGDGPLWPDVVLQESDICRRKFLWHGLFLHNFIDNDAQCLLPAWSIAVDVQLFVAAHLLMSFLEATGRKPIPILSVMFVVFSVLNGLLAYCNQWEPMVFIALPENLRLSFRGVRSFSQFYISPLSNVTANLLGIILAYALKHVRENGIKLSKITKVIFYCGYHLSFPLMISWIMCGEWFFERRSPIVTAVYAGIERPVFLMLLIIYSIGLTNNLDGLPRRLALWRWWRPLDRLALPVLVVHWLVIKTILASRQGLIDCSEYNLAMDTLRTTFFSYCLALPLTILVEMPIMKTLNSVLKD